MKFSWKIFFLFTSLITIVFCIFGVWMVDSTFQASFAREVERGNSENQMFQFAFEMSMDTVPDKYLLNEEDAVKDIAYSLKGSLSGSDIRIYNSDKKVLYDNARVQTDSDFIDYLKEKNSGYEIIRDKDRYFLRVMCSSEVNLDSYYLENLIDISYIYEEREMLFERYQIAVALLLVVTGLVTLFLSYYLTRSVVGLSKAARNFSNGDYQSRAKKHGNDEIGELTEDFNLMADNLSMKIEQLALEARRQEDFTASFAHELKTPLTSIIGYADMIRTVDLDQEETLEAAEYIYSQGKRLESLSFKLLELFGVQRREEPFVVIDMSSMLKETGRIVSSSLEKKKIYLDMKLEEGEILGDWDLLLSLFVNLVDNARKASEEGSTIWISGTKNDREYVVHVRDEGYGIPEEEVGKITEAFYMVDKSRSRKEGSAGLGMALCSKIVNIHGATWYIKSKETQGTSIWVTFLQEEK